MELNKMQRRERERRKKKLKMDEIKLDAEVRGQIDIEAGHSNFFSKWCRFNSNRHLFFEVVSVLLKPTLLNSVGFNKTDTS
jgi:hypothetical protein